MAEILSREKIAGLLAEKGALETITHYLGLLAEAFLIKPLYKYPGSELRRRKSPPKIVVLNNALLAGASALAPPSREHEPERWGRWVENACLAHLINTGQEVYYWREEPWEVDALVVGKGATHLVEIKTGRYSAEDLRGLAHAAKRFPAFEPLVLCDSGEERVARAAGFRTMPWPDFLMKRPGPLF